MNALLEPIATADELADFTADPFPEFALWTKKIPFFSPEKTARIVARLKRYAVRAPNGRCIWWTGSLNRLNGYGRLTVRHPSYPLPFPEYVHRLSWYLVHGKDIPEGDQVDHKCDTPRCFSPLCVRLLSATKNAQRAAVNTNRKKLERAGAAA